MSTPDPLDDRAEFTELASAPASDVKKKGWRRLMKTLRTEGDGRLLVTNHDEPQAVILSAEEYVQMMRQVRRGQVPVQGALEELRERFDRRLAALQADDAGDRLRRVMREPAALHGEVKAGKTF